MNSGTPIDALPTDTVSIERYERLGRLFVCQERFLEEQDAEIERLHGQIHTLLERGDELRNDKKELREIIAIREGQLEHCRKDAERMQKEIERLREALKKIADHEWLENALEPQWASAVARDALAKEDK
jgi:chromosome segregation ATPase